MELVQYTYWAEFVYIYLLMNGIVYLCVFVDVVGIPTLKKLVYLCLLVDRARISISFCGRTAALVGWLVLGLTAL